jgi:hypothetical protein
VGQHFTLERLKHLPHFMETRLMIAMDRGHFAGHEIEARQFFAQIFVMHLFDVIAQLRQSHCVGICLHGIRGIIQCGQERNDGRGIESLGLTGFGQRLLAPQQ